MAKNNYPNRMSLDITQMSDESLKEIRDILENEKFFNAVNNNRKTTDLALHITQINMELKGRGAE